MLLKNRENTNYTIYSPFGTPSVASGAQAVNRSSVSALAFLLWDILITFDDEVKLVWPRLWSYTKVVYFIIRYLPLMMEVSLLFAGSELTPLFHFTLRDCFIWQVYQGVGASIVVIAVDTVLILRVHALYRGNNLMRRTVGAFFICEIIGMATGLALTLPGITFGDVCVVTGIPHTLVVYAAPAITFQTFLFGVTLYKFIDAVRSGWGDVPLVILLMRDGSWAFLLLFCVYVGQIGLYGLPNHSFSGILYNWVLTGFSFAGYRILLNLNDLADRTAGADRTTNRNTDTNIQFSTQMFDSQRGTYEEEIF